MASTFCLNDPACSGFVVHSNIIYLLDMSASFSSSLQNDNFGISKVHIDTDWFQSELPKKYKPATDTTGLNEQVFLSLSTHKMDCYAQCLYGDNCKFLIFNPALAVNCYLGNSDTTGATFTPDIMDGAEVIRSKRVFHEGFQLSLTFVSGVNIPTNFCKETAPSNYDYFGQPNDQNVLILK